MSIYNSICFLSKSKYFIERDRPTDVERQTTSSPTVPSGHDELHACNSSQIHASLPKTRRPTNSFISQNHQLRPHLSGLQSRSYDTQGRFGHGMLPPSKKEGRFIAHLADATEFSYCCWRNPLIYLLNPFDFPPVGW